MGSGQSYIIHKIKKRVFIISAAVILLTITASVVLYYTNMKDFTQWMIEDKLGHQRMLTQKLAKDADRIYVLRDLKKDGTAIDTEQSIDKKLKDTSSDIIKAKNDFNQILKNINTGTFSDSNGSVQIHRKLSESESEIKEINQLWDKYNAEIEVLINSTASDSDQLKALAFIDDNNQRLLDLCEVITQDFVTASRNENNANMYIAIILLVISVLIISLTLFHLYKYIIIPLNELYKALPKLGGTLSDKRSIPTGSEIQPVVDEINGAFIKLKKLINLIENINNNSSFNDVLKIIYKSFSDFIPYCYIGIALIKDNGESIEASYGISDGEVKNLVQYLGGKRYSLKETSLAKIVETGRTRIINDMERYVKGKEIKEYTKIVMEAGIQSSITLPLNINKKPIGIIFFSSKYKNIYNKRHIEFLETIANSIALSIDKNILVDNLLYSSILALAKLAEARDEDTGEHLDRMKVYSRILTQLLYQESKYRNSITPEFINDMERFSPLHDIGKVGIRDGILLKPGKLTDQEFEEMKSHTKYGADVLRAAEENMENTGKSMFKLGIEIAEGHHEKWNGTGYPYGKKGEEIPLSSRIVAVADVFDALTSKRPYKEAFGFEESFRIIVDGSGSHFDPEIVRVFVGNKTVFYSLYNSFQINNDNLTSA